MKKQSKSPILDKAMEQMKREHCLPVRREKAQEAQSKPQHTPGRWTIETQGDGRSHIVSLANGQRYVIGVFGDVSRIPEAAANARLIAAAPALLAAAEKFWAFYTDLAASNPGFLSKLCLQNYARWNEAMTELPAAIGQARGGFKQEAELSQGNNCQGNKPETLSPPPPHSSADHSPASSCEGNVSWLLPATAAKLIRDTLELDSRSKAFDPELREQIRVAVDAIEVL